MNDEPPTLAYGMLRIAIRRMIRENPFHARTLSPDSLVCEPDVNTMGVTIRDGRIQFPYTPEFVLRCSYDELIGAFQHEVNHLLFGHVIADPQEFPDCEARLIAEEVTVNEWVAAPLPGRPITLDQFPALKPLGDTKGRYDYLAKKTVEEARKIELSERKIRPSGPKSGTSGQDSGPSAPKTAQVFGLGGGFISLDNHEIWKAARENPILGKLVIAAAVREARDALDDSQWQRLPDDIRRTIEELIAGRSPGIDTENLTDTGSCGLIDWRKQLRRYIAQTAVTYPMFHRPPRRMPELVGILPANCRLAEKPIVMAIIDTSDSMILALLEILCAELKRLARDFQVVVVECDAAIRATYRYRSSLKILRGRGGTDLRPPFDSHFLAKIRPDVIIYFTDGDGPAPDRPPSIPVIWCLTPLGSRPAAWGREIRMRGT